jgi:hypothetical protein
MHLAVSLVDMFSRTVNMHIVSTAHYVDRDRRDNAFGKKHMFQCEMFLRSSNQKHSVNVK